MLREPVDRAISVYYFHRNNVNLPPGPHINAAKRLTAEEYFFSDSRLILGPIANYQTKHFMQLEVDGGNELTEMEQLDLAKRALARYDLVGIYLHLQEFIDIMCFNSGLEPVDQIPSVNVTSRRLRINEVDPRIIDRLQELNRLDTSLFEYATELFHKKRSRIIRECIQQNETRDSSHVGLERQEAYELVNSTDESKSDECAEFGNRRIEIISVKVIGALSMNASLLSGETAHLKIEFIAHEPADDLTVV